MFGIPNLGNLGDLMGQGGNPNAPLPDTSETIVISSIALLKMLKHGRAGIPMEVMGLMLGEFVDEYTIYVADVFAMPQTGTGVSVEAVDPIYQQQMVELLDRVSKKGVVVGWYHSHPGFGCWLSSVDMNTQQAMERLDERAVAVVVDPVQSVRGNVVIDAFRLFKGIGMGDTRQTTCNRGHINPPSLQAEVHGLGTQYYSMPITYRRNPYEDAMLAKLGARQWDSGLVLDPEAPLVPHDEDLLDLLAKRIRSERTMGVEKTKLESVGKIDPRRRLQDLLERAIIDAADTATILSAASMAFVDK
eukprot:gnl/Chilomastix_cuspidata/1015.p1 GENE.gnl/Chilomastix_cuspidata/1015~~gnl/Chilomastix_cuspidata/1015.p1  ORF type:complete len:303 (+),score=87.87 gnl/Chilomastix_cuspidata/1015:40-948(+)